MRKPYFSQVRRMRTILRLATIAWVGVLAGIFSERAMAEPVNLREGLWRMEIEMTIPGRGPETGPLTHERCLSPNNVMQLVVPPNSPCRIGSMDMQASRMRWKVSCVQGEVRAKGEGALVFADDKFSGEMMTSTEPFGIKVTQKVSGRYLGACPVPKAGKKALPTPAGGLQPYGE
jgi:hypothetical protein